MDHLRSQTQRLLSVTSRLGWIPCPEKSELTPTQDFIFISMHYRTDLGLLFPPEVRFREAACHARRVLFSRFPLAARETCFNVRDGAFRQSQISTPPALSVGPLTSQSWLVNRQDFLGSSLLGSLPSGGPSHPIFFRGGPFRRLTPNGHG